MTFRYLQSFPEAQRALRHPASWRHEKVINRRCIFGDGQFQVFRCRGQNRIWEADFDEFRPEKFQGPVIRVAVRPMDNDLAFRDLFGGKGGVRSSAVSGQGGRSRDMEGACRPVGDERGLVFGEKRQALMRLRLQFFDDDVTSRRLLHSVKRPFAHAGASYHRVGSRRVEDLLYTQFRVNISGHALVTACLN